MARIDLLGDAAGAAAARAPDGRADLLAERRDWLRDRIDLLHDRDDFGHDRVADSRIDLLDDGIDRLRDRIDLLRDRDASADDRVADGRSDLLADRIDLRRDDHTGEDPNDLLVRRIGRLRGRVDALRDNRSDVAEHAVASTLPDRQGASAVAVQVLADRPPDHADAVTDQGADQGLARIGWMLNREERLFRRQDTDFAE